MVDGSNKSPNISDEGGDGNDSTLFNSDEWFEKVFNLGLNDEIPDDEGLNGAIPTVDATLHRVKIVDKLWSKEIYEMPKEDREGFLAELHGVQSLAVSETQATIQLGLETMEHEICKMVFQQSSSESSSVATNLTKSYLLAVEELKSEYVVAPEFRIRFLRTEFYDAQKAAVRYFKYLNLLYKTFGDCALRRPLQLSDLSDIEKAYIGSGKVQILRSRDRMGRRIRLAYIGNLYGFPKSERQRASIYLTSVMAEDKETQIHGGIIINICNLGEEVNNFIDGKVPEFNDWEQRLLINRGSGLLARKIFLERAEASPIRWSSIHICMPEKRINHLFRSALLFLLPNHFRQRTCLHIGSHMEYCYDLCQFGIPAGDIQNNFGNDLTVKSNSVARFLKGRQSVESFRTKYCAKHGFDYYLQTSKQKSAKDNTRNESSAEGTAVYEMPRPRTFISEDICPGTECPESNTVIFGDRVTYKCRANVEFREYLWTKEKFFFPSDAEITATEASISNSLVRLNAKVMDNIINEVYANPPGTTTNDDAAFGNDSNCSYTRSKRFKFAIYERHHGWYRYMDPINSESDRIELRKKISQTVRDERKRIMLGGNVNEQKAITQKRRQREASSEAWDRSNALSVHEQNCVQKWWRTPTNTIGLNPNKIANTTHTFNVSSTSIREEFPRKRRKISDCNFCKQNGSIIQCFCGH